MSHSLQVLYPITESTNFDYDYYFEKPVADIANFTNTKLIMLIGEVIS